VSKNYFLDDGQLKAHFLSKFKFNWPSWYLNWFRSTKFVANVTRQPKNRVAYHWLKAFITFFHSFLEVDIEKVNLNKL